ncbi:cyclin-A1-1 [Cornus florida]|uniref:cyclin-A1-1 n=1 Tax=Cornus florida TaxID=4283 RepID=UPI00289EB338|nr:cyclin-A1-1 [Cornus florida]
MSTKNRRSTGSSSLQSSSSLAKRHASSSSENLGKVTAAPPRMAKKRPPLANVTNQREGSQNGSRNSGFGSSNMVPCVTKIVNAKKGSSACSNNAAFSGSILPTSSNAKPSVVASGKVASFSRSDEILSRITAPPAPCSMDICPIESDGSSVSLDETMSTCDSLKSPEVEYIDNNDVAAINSIERKTCSKLFISEHDEPSGNICKREILGDMEATDKIVDIDGNLVDPQLCATMACDIYKHLRASEARKRPSTDFMERVQKDINASMRSILIDWLVEVSEEYRLVPDTLYLTINYIDRYLSGNVVDRQRLQLLGVACMMIAAKYEEICAPQVEEFCYITDNTYFKEEVLQMESSVLNYLKFEMTAPTAKCFLRRFVRAAQGVNEAPSFLLECLANYLAELSLLEYNMLCYAPSLIAASAIFLANYMLNPSKRPWNFTLRHYTQYEPSDLCDCVKALHSLRCNNYNSSLPAVREKYSQHKYKFVAKKYCPPTIPPEFFYNLSS